MRRIMRFFKEEDGVVNIEYALIAALIAVALIAVLGLVADEIANILNTIKDTLANAT